MMNPRLTLACIVALAGCDACNPKVIPDLSGDQVDTGPDSTTVDTEDTATTEVIDTAPPPPCAHPEVEPNNDPANPERIELETVVCGQFVIAEEGAVADLDWFTFEVDDASWIKVDVNAVNLGSSADPSLYIASEDDHYMLIESDVDSTDPKVIFPIPEGTDDWDLMVAELNSLSGERYIWEFIVSATKAPVEWNRDEVEPNNEPEEAVELSEGDVVFGQYDSQSDLEQFYIDPPEGWHELTVRVTAKSEGSAAYNRLVLSRDRSPDTGDSPIDLDRIASVTGGAGTSPDAILSFEADGSERLYLTLRENEGNSGPGHWYIIEITSIVEIDPPDTSGTTTEPAK